MMTSLMTPIIGKGYRSNIEVYMTYYPQEYAAADYKPYSVLFVDYSDTENPEEITTGEYDDRSEARAAYDSLIKTATEYAKSLLRDVYTFSDYLIFNEIIKEA